MESRNWMYGDRTKIEFFNGVKEFWRMAKVHQKSKGLSTIFCPCRDCNNVRCAEIGTIAEHLFRRGFRQGYTNWYWHGEDMLPDQEPLVSHDDEKIKKVRKETGQNANPHIMGHLSYERAITKAVDEGRFPSLVSTQASSVGSTNTTQTSLVATTDRAEIRPLFGVLPTKRNLLNDTCCGPPKNTHHRCGQKIRTYLDNEAKAEEDDTFNRKRGRDAFVEGLGKPDHYDRTRGISRSNDDIRAVSSKKDRKTPPSSASEEVKTIVAHIRDDIWSQFNERVNAIVQAQLKDVVQEAVETHLVKILGLGSPVCKVPSPTPMVTSPPRALPPRSPPILPSTNTTPRLLKGAQPVRKSIGSTTSKDPVGEKEEQSLGGECNLLLCILIEAPVGEYDSTVITLDPPYAYLKETVVVTKNDAFKFLRLDWINVSIIQIYQLFLRDEFPSLFKLSFMSFLCPSKLNADTITKSPEVVNEYVRDAFIAEKDKGDNQCKYILAPYNEGEHWMLYVIELQAGRGFLFNSREQGLGKVKQQKASMVFDTCFRTYKTMGGKCPNNRKRLVWDTIECPQQRTGSECGYYIMMYMLEITTTYFDRDQPLCQAYNRSKLPYSLDQLNFVREQWARFFMPHLF